MSLAERLRDRSAEKAKESRRKQAESLLSKSKASVMFSDFDIVDAPLKFLYEVDHEKGEIREVAEFSINFKSVLTRKKYQPNLTPAGYDRIIEDLNGKRLQ